MTRERMTRTFRTLVLAPIACLLLSGCRVSEHKNGDNDNVDIGTPFGSMHVNTNDSANTSAIGIAAYPGAVPLKDDDDKDGNSADVNLSFGSFHLGVRAASFQTSDSEEKVLAFYRKDLAARYGSVIECQGSHTVGTPARTAQGLTCEEKNHVRVNGLPGKGIQLHGGLSTSTDLELRAGSEQHQHIAGVEPHDGGTKISLVALNLPSDSSVHDSSDSE